MPIAWIALPTATPGLVFARSGNVWKQIAERINRRVIATRRNDSQRISTNAGGVSVVSTTWPTGLMSDALEGEPKAEYWPELIRIAAGRLQALIAGELITMADSGLTNDVLKRRCAGAFFDSDFTTPYSGIGSASSQPIATMLAEHPPEHPSEWGGWIRYLRAVIDGLQHIRWNEMWIPVLESSWWEYYAGGNNYGPLGPGTDPIDLPVPAATNMRDWFFQDGEDVSPLFFNWQGTGGTGAGTAPALDIDDSLTAPDTPAYLRRAQTTTGLGVATAFEAVTGARLDRTMVGVNDDGDVFVRQSGWFGRWWAAHQKPSVGVACDVVAATFTPGTAIVASGDMEGDTEANVYLAGSFAPNTALGTQEPPGEQVSQVSPVVNGTTIMDTPENVASAVGAVMPTELWIGHQAIIEPDTPALPSWDWDMDAFSDGTLTPEEQVEKHFEQIDDAPAGTFRTDERVLAMRLAASTGDGYRHGSFKVSLTIPDGE